MKNMDKDIYLKDYLVSRVISFGKEIPGYGRIYYRTNEDLVSSYQDMDFENKKVLSVLASSDQVYTARYLGATQVDSFDKNRLTLYYYYLRKWTIKYNNELYPDILGKNNNWLRSLLSKVKPKSTEEEKALMFFEKHIYDRTRLSELFYGDYIDTDKGKTLYSEADELSSTIDMPMKFVDFDMFTDTEIEDSYDILLISNILDWARGDKVKFMVARDNLYKLLKKDGIVLCSRLVDRSEFNINNERRIFDKNFEYIEQGRDYIYRKK